MSTTLLPEGVSGIDADLVSFLGRGLGSVKNGVNWPTAMDVQSFLLQGG